MCPDEIRLKQASGSLYDGCLSPPETSTNNLLESPAFPERGFRFLGARSSAVALLLILYGLEPTLDLLAGLEVECPFF